MAIKQSIQNNLSSQDRKRLGAGDPTRERLLVTAIDLFTSRGYTATSVRSIVEGARVTKPALYYHFRSKEGIYLAILEDVQRILDEELAVQRERQGTARERIESLFLGLFDLFERNQRAVRFINAAFWGSPQGAPPFDFETFHARMQKPIAEIVADGIASGELRPVPVIDAVYALIGVLSFSMDLTLAHPEIGLGRDGLLRALDLTFTGIASPRPVPQEKRS